MSYGLLWIETLLASLLFAAMLMTLGLRRKTRKASIFLCGAGLLLPMIPLGALLSLMGGLRFISGLRSGGFWWAIALVVCYLSGAIATLVIARRHDAAGVRRAFSWPLARIATAWLVVVSLIAMTLWNMDLRAQVEIQALRAEAGAIALSVAPPQISDSANAAILYEQADEQSKTAATSEDKDVDYRDLDIRSPQVKAYLQRQRKTLDVIRRAADMPECRLDYGYAKPDVETVMRSLPQFRRSAILLELAANGEAAEGNAAAALADCRRMYAVADHANSSPLLISGLVVIATDALASKTVVGVLPSVTRKDELDHFLAPEPRALSRTMARSFRGEEAMGLALLCDMASGTYMKPSATTASKVGGMAMWLTWLQDDLEIYRENLQRLREIALQPYYQTVDARKEFEEHLQPGKRRGVFTAIITPSLLNSIRSLAGAQALRSTAAVAIAATRYRLDHGDYPAASNLLVPQYMDAMPLDPFDGQPLRLKRLPNGSLTIYSIGNDGKDDGGDVDSDGDKHTHADVGIILKMPPAK